MFQVESGRLELPPSSAYTRDVICNNATKKESLTIPASIPADKESSNDSVGIYDGKPSEVLARTGVRMPGIKAESINSDEECEESDCYVEFMDCPKAPGIMNYHGKTSPTLGNDDFAVTYDDMRLEDNSLGQPRFWSSCSLPFIYTRARNKSLWSKNNEKTN
jgi:hypothetical protein